MSFRIIYTLKRVPFCLCKSMHLKKLSRDTRDTGCTQNRLCKGNIGQQLFPFDVIMALLSTVKVKSGKCNV